MRKRRMIWTSGATALLSLALAAAMACGAAAQSRATPWLGVTTQDITSELRDGLDYQGSGVIVNRVVRDGPADKAGIRKGDVITTLNSRTIDSASELTDVVRAGRVGQTVSVGIVRDGARRSVTARLGERPDNSYWESDDNGFPEPPEAPEAPRAPRAPRAPQAFRFDWNGDDFDFPGGSGLTMLRGLGRGRLGIQIQDIDSDLGDALGVPDGKGVLVMDVFKDTPAERAGMKSGDVITRVGDKSIDDVNDLRDALRDEEGRVTLTVMRKGVRRSVTAELERRRDLDRRTIRIPDIRTRAMRDRDRDSSDRGDMQQEMDELRQELRELRRQMEAKDNK